MEIKPKYYLKRKLKNGDIALIPCADPPQDQEPNPAGLKKLNQLKAQYQLGEFFPDEKRNKKTTEENKEDNLLFDRR